jgi:hypothetical protein
MKLALNLSRLLSALSIISLLALASCQKEESADGSDQAQQLEASRASSEADSEAENVFSGIFDDAYGADDEVGLSGTGVFWSRVDTMTPVPRCFTVTVVRLNPPAQFPVKFIVDFGTAGCTGPDGHTRKGKIITVYSNRLTVPEATAVTTFDGFFVDNIKVEGTHKITNIGPAPATPLVRKFKVEVIDAKLTRPDGNYTEWNSTKTILQIDGLGTPFVPHDDAFKIEGSARGRVKRGSLLVAWESAITEPLFKRFSCRWIVKGRIRTVRLNNTTSSPWVAFLDFGTGICDNLGTVTINGITYQITLR